MAFLIGGANSAADTGFNIANSLRSNQPDGAYLSFALSSPNTDIFTISIWVKTSLVASGTQHFAELGKSLTGEAGDYTTFAGLFDVDGRSSYDAYDGVNNAYIIRWGAPPATIFRDPSAWYHIVCRMDSSQGTLANRARIYVNGDDISSRLTHTVDPDQNDDYFHATDSSVFFPGGANTGGSKWNGYIAEAAYIDGTSYAASTFGETDEDSGIWKPKDFKGDVTFGTNGLYLEFKQSGTGTNASGLGADTSGNDNHMAVTNFVATDQTEDTPTNNFATFNPLIVSTNYHPTFTEGNTKVAVNATGKHGGYSTIGVANGKWYAEFKCVTDIASTVGIVNDPSEQVRTFGKPGEGTYDVGYLSATGNKLIGDSSTTHGATYEDGDIIMVALDLTNNNVYLGKNGSWNDGSGNADESSINSAISITAASSTPSGFYFFGTGDNDGGSAGGWEANFGSPPYAISSGNTDGKYGNFEYAPPSGYYALCTKRLAEFG